LLSSADQVIRIRSAAELNGEGIDHVPILVQPRVRRIIAKQQPDGSWHYPGRRVGPKTNYEFLETYRNLGELVELYALGREHPSVERAAEFLYSLQTEEGDFRGIYGREYSPNYTSGVIAVLAHAGYDSDPRVARGLRWLVAMRQDDGGWAIPLRTIGWKFHQPMPEEQQPVQPDRSKPSSHMVTGIVLRALAASERYRRTDETRVAGELLASRMFMAD
jgi:squalene cyclase